MVLAGARIDIPEKKGAAPKVQVDEEEREYIGISSDGRVVMMEQFEDIERVLEVQKAIVSKVNSLSIRSDLVDPGIYMFADWVALLVLESPALVNLRTDLVPFLVRRQFQSRAYISEKISCLENRYKSCRGIDRWLSYRGNSLPPSGEKDSVRSAELCDLVLEELDQLQGPPTSRDGSLSRKEDRDDYIRCMAYVCEHTAGHEGGLVRRVGSVSSYLAVNRS
jgi:hypothetical protein